MAEPIFAVNKLSKQYQVNGQSLSAVNNADLAVYRNETLALVGESGSGKTSLSRLLLLLEEPSAGELLFKGQNTGEFNKQQLRDFRRSVQPVFQNPFSSLNPRLRVKHIVAEPLTAQTKLSKQEIAERVAWALTATGLRPEDGEKFPHQFSGGQRQRVAIARAIISRPELIILDEPVSSQDISIQAQILNLLKDLQQELGMSYLFIAHDLATVRFLSDRVAVMYLGKIVETGPTESVFKQPGHPYTQALLNSVLPEMPGQAVPVEIMGEIPSPLNPPSGCTFHPRCPMATTACKATVPELTHSSGEHLVACINQKLHWEAVVNE